MTFTVKNSVSLLQTLETEDGFIIEITADMEEETYEAWLHHKDYGIKSLLHGEPFYQTYRKTHTSPDEFLERSMFDISAEIDSYRNEYMD